MRAKLFLIVLLLIVGLPLCSCQIENVDLSKSEAPKSTPAQTGQIAASNAIRIGVSLQGLQRPYIVRVKEQLERIEKNMNGAIELTILDGQEDAEKQNAQVERFISKKDGRHHFQRDLL